MIKQPAAERNQLEEWNVHTPTLVLFFIIIFQYG
jgi:hypothetical protein